MSHDYCSTCYYYGQLCNGDLPCGEILAGNTTFQCDSYDSIENDMSEFELENLIESNRKEFHELWTIYISEYDDV